MAIQRARSVDALYDAVADYDLVLVRDASLASAINRRLDVPHFGTFATTPRRLAAGRREQAEDRTAFLEVVDQTAYDWKSVSYAIGNVLQCWEHQGSLDSILDYEPYADDVTREVVEILTDLPTTSSRLSEYTISDDEDVAVVGESLFTNLEREVIPDEADPIALFTDEPFDLPQMNIFDSSADILDAILDIVDAESADNVAIVLEGNSRYSSLVESALEANDVPYFGGPGFVDDPNLRSFITLCRTPFRGAETTVADVRSVLVQLSATVDIDHHEKRLHAVDIPETEWIRSFCDSLESRTFAEALDIYEAQIDESMDRFRSELDSLGIVDVAVEEDRLDELAYYLQSYDVPIKRDNEGVLLADAKSSGYVDRPVVFHLGLDEGWTHSAPQRPWVDAESQFERYIRQFQLLLQSGVNQYYLVQDTAGGQPVIPCLYFGELLDEDYERFSDLESVRHRRHDDRSDGFDREETGVEPAALDTISNSSLTTYVNSPRDYFFDRLVDGPDKDYFREGNLFHDFAEFYVTHPGVIEAVTIDEIVELMLEDAAPFFSETDRPLRRRKYQIGLETITEYLDEQHPFEDDFVTPASGWGTNFFAEYYGKPVDSPITERWFEDESLGMKGKIDLIADPDHLLDFKSGRKKNRRAVVKGAAIDPPDETPDFQAAMYLCYYRSERPEEPLQFTFFHFLDILDDVIAGSYDIEDTLTTVSYYPWTFDEYVGSREAFDELLDGYNDCVATFEDLGFDAYQEIVAGGHFPDTTERSELRESEFAAEFTTTVDRRTSDDVDAEKGADQAIRLLNGLRKKTFFREDLDAFETFVHERIDELNEYRAGEDRFPIEGPGGEPNYRRVDHRDLLLEDERE